MFQERKAVEPVASGRLGSTSDIMLHAVPGLPVHRSSLIYVHSSSDERTASSSSCRNGVLCFRVFIDFVHDRQQACISRGTYQASPG